MAPWHEEVHRRAESRRGSVTEGRDRARCKGSCVAQGRAELARVARCSACAQPAGSRAATALRGASCFPPPGRLRRRLAAGLQPAALWRGRPRGSTGSASSGRSCQATRLRRSPLSVACRSDTRVRAVPSGCTPLKNNLQTRAVGAPACRAAAQQPRRSRVGGGYPLLLLVGGRKELDSHVVRGARSQPQPNPKPRPQPQPQTPTPPQPQPAAQTRTLPLPCPGAGPGLSTNIGRPLRLAGGPSAEAHRHAERLHKDIVKGHVRARQPLRARATAAAAAAAAAVAAAAVVVVAAAAVAAAAAAAAAAVAAPTRRSTWKRTTAYSSRCARTGAGAPSGGPRSCCSAAGTRRASSPR